MADTLPPADDSADLPVPSGDGAAAPVMDRVEDLRIEQELQDSYLTYAMSTIMDRALPDVRDGLKPSQRRILVAMNDLKLGPRLQALQVRQDRRGHLRQLPPPRRPGRLPDPRPARAGVEPPLHARRPAGQFRQHRRRPARGRPVHRGTHDQRGHGTAPGLGPRHRRLPAQLRRPVAGADGPAQQVPQPAGQRLHRHRRRHGVQPRPAQPPRDLRRHRQGDRQPQRHPARTARSRPRPRLPHRRRHLRARRDRRGVQDRPRQAHPPRARSRSRSRRAAGRSSSSRRCPTTSSARRSSSRSRRR